MLASRGSRALFISKRSKEQIFCEDLACDHALPVYLLCLSWEGSFSLSSGLSLRAGGRGFSPATKRVAPGYFYWKIEEK